MSRSAIKQPPVRRVPGQHIDRQAEDAAANERDAEALARFFKAILKDGPKPNLTGHWRGRLMRTPHTPRG